MKRTIFIGCLIALLSACGTDLTETELSTAGFSDVPIVTDNEQIAEGLGAAGFETILTEPDNLLEVHNEVGGGLVSYTPLPPEIDPWPWNPRPWPIPWCDPRWCDPVDFSPVVGWDFEGAYITPEFAETLMSYDLALQEVSELSQQELGNVFTEVFEVDTSIRIGSVTCDPAGCQGTTISVSPICFASRSCMGYHLQRAKENIDRYIAIQHLHEVDVIFTGNAGLNRVEAGLGNLTQLQGEGVAPVIQGLNVAVHTKVGEEMGTMLAESLFSEEVQVSLFEHAGVLPVHADLLDEVMNEHIEGALKHGTLSEDPQPVFFRARPTPVPVDARPTPIPVN